MPIVTIKLHNKSFQLACNEGAEEQLFNLAKLLNERIEEVKKGSPAASFELSLVITALDLQEQVQILSAHNKNIAGEKVDYEEEKLAETLSTIASYLESIAQKISK